VGDRIWYIIYIIEKDFQIVLTLYQYLVYRYLNLEKGCEIMTYERDEFVDKLMDNIMKNNIISGIDKLLTIAFMTIFLIGLTNLAIANDTGSGNCVVPYKGMTISSNTQLCFGNYSLSTNNNGQPHILGLSHGDIIINNDNIILDCNGSPIYGVGIGIENNGHKNVTIRNCEIYGYSKGIYFYNDATGAIENNSFFNNEFNIYSDSSSLNVINNRLFGGKYGIYSTHGSTINAEDNNIFNTDYGIYLTGPGNTITNNHFSSNEFHIFIDADSYTDCDNDISHNDELNNIFDGHDILYYNSKVDLSNIHAAELILCNADYSNINNVTIMSADANSSSNGIVLIQTDFANITGSDSRYNYIGISLYSSTNNTITNNYFDHNGDYGIFTDINSKFNTFYNNHVCEGNGTYDIYDETDNDNAYSDNYCDSKFVGVASGNCAHVCSGFTCQDIDRDGYGVCPHCNITNGCLFDGNDCADYDPTRPMIEDCSNSIDDDCDGLIDNDDPDCWYVDLDDPSTWDPDNDGISNVENVSGEYLIDQDVRLVNKIYNIPSNSPAISINCDNCVLDCNGAIINGTGYGQGIVNDGHDNITIKNCYVNNYNIGIDFVNDSDNNHLTDNHACGNNIDIHLSSDSNNNIGDNIFGTLDDEDSNSIIQSDSCFSLSHCVDFSNPATWDYNGNGLPDIVQEDYYVYRIVESTKVCPNHQDFIKLTVDDNVTMTCGIGSKSKSSYYAGEDSTANTNKAKGTEQVALVLNNNSVIDGCNFAADSSQLRVLINGDSAKLLNNIFFNFSIDVNGSGAQIIGNKIHSSNTGISAYSNDNLIFDNDIDGEIGYESYSGSSVAACNRMTTTTGANLYGGDTVFEYNKLISTNGINVSGGTGSLLYNIINADNGITGTGEYQLRGNILDYRFGVISLDWSGPEAEFYDNAFCSGSVSHGSGVWDEFVDKLMDNIMKNNIISGIDKLLTIAFMTIFLIGLTNLAIANDTGSGNCVVPYKGMTISSNTQLCFGNYSLSTNNNGQPHILGLSHGDIIINNDNIILDCNGSPIYGVGIGIENNGHKNVTIRNCEIYGYSKGIYFYNDATGAIENNSFFNNEFNIYSDSSSLNVINNRLFGGKYGIYSTHGSTINAEDNNIFNTDYGIYLTGPGNTITNNHFSSNEFHIFIDADSYTDCDNDISHNDELNNIFDGHDILYYNSKVDLSNIHAAELILCNADYSNINNVTIMSADANSSSNGIVLIQTDFANITGSDSRYNYIGISLYSSTNNTITNNYFDHNGDYGIFTDINSKFNTFYNNHVCEGNGTYDIYDETDNDNAYSDNYCDSKFVGVASGNCAHVCSGFTCQDIDRDGYGVCPHCNITNGCLFDGNDCADYDPTRPMIEDCSNSIDDDCDGLIDNDDPDCWYVDLDDPSTWDPDNDGISNVENVSGEYLIDQDVRLVNKIYNIPSNSPAISINCDNCVLDCNGAIINGTGYGQGIVNDGHDNITIKNCYVNNYNIGIDFVNDSDNNHLTDNHACGNNIDIHLSSDSNNNIGDNIFGTLDDEDSNSIIQSDSCFSLSHCVDFSNPATWDYNGNGLPDIVQEDYYVYRIVESTKVCPNHQDFIKLTVDDNVTMTCGIGSKSKSSYYAGEDSTANTNKAKGTEQVALVLNNNSVIDGCNFAADSSQLRVLINGDSAKLLNNIFFNFSIDVNGSGAQIIGNKIHSSNTGISAYSNDNLIFDNDIDGEIGYESYSGSSVAACNRMTTTTGANLYGGDTVFEYNKLISTNGINVSGGTGSLLYNIINADNGITGTGEYQLRGNILDYRFGVISLDWSGPEAEFYDNAFCSGSVSHGSGVWDDNYCQATDCQPCEIFDTRYKDLTCPYEYSDGKLTVIMSPEPLTSIEKLKNILLSSLAESPLINTLSCEESAAKLHPSITELLLSTKATCSVPFALFVLAVESSPA